jgi:hypothetical protein
MRTYSKQKKARHVRWHKEYNQKHQYATDETKGKKYSWSEMYLIWNKRLTGGRILTDVEIAKLLNRSLQAIQLKRHKMTVGTIAMVGMRRYVGVQ